MKRIARAIALCLFVSPAAAMAAPPVAVPVASPAPSAPAGTFNDPAMAFTAPAGYLKLNVPPHDPANFEGSTVVAAFVKSPGKDEQRLITISMENWDGFNLEGFEGTNENELRGQVQSLFVSKKERTTLSNGMPAYWRVISVGSGFQSEKWYEYAWIDGMRAVTLAIKARLGELDEKEARDALSNATAVAYPRR
ncbi:MAG: hypothetical protein M3R35_04565 [Candidatus Eremiobacteraeota bacterium]|nr:hypothetical protein [Candidatus Eremiobacteraeota bacterium]